MFGFINIYKPKGITSHDVISKLRRATKIRQIGHAGTLDPMAEGVLPIAIGKASRLLEYLTDDKGYIAELWLGKISDTYDTEGNVENFSNKKVTESEIKEALKIFNGEIEQIPPAHSAVHYKGKRLYELARQGIIPDDIPRRKVFISKCNLLEFDEKSQTAKIEIECSKGTYIRSIINDLGMNLESGAVMSGLVRTKSSGFTLKNATPLEELNNTEALQKVLINPLNILKYQKYELNEKELEKISHGMGIKNNKFEENEIVILTKDNILCAIALKSNGILKTKKVFIE